MLLIGSRNKNGEKPDELKAFRGPKASFREWQPHQMLPLMFLDTPRAVLLVPQAMVVVL